MTLDRAIDFIKNEHGVIEMKLKDFVKATSFSPMGGGSERILLETRGLIKKKIIDLYGNYDEELKAAAQREWWGKLMFFLRKWIVSAGLRRWRGIETSTRDSKTLRDVDKFYSEDLKANQEGYYVTAIRFVATMIRSIKAGQVEALSTNFNELSKTSILKKLTGQDLIGFEYKNKNPFEERNYAKILISTNNLPETTDKTIGFYRRWMIVDFPNSFSEQEDILSKIPEEEYESLALKCAHILKDLLDERKFHNEGSIEDSNFVYASGV